MGEIDRTKINWEWMNVEVFSCVWICICMCHDRLKRTSLFSIFEVDADFIIRHDLEFLHAQQICLIHYSQPMVALGGNCLWFTNIVLIKLPPSYSITLCDYRCTGRLNRLIIRRSIFYKILMLNCTFPFFPFGFIGRVVEDAAQPCNCLFYS